jgi:uncharacterized protein YbjT (DUF2867 family)
MQGIETVVNAVQFPNNPIERKSKGWTFEEVDYKGTVNQVNAAKAAGVKRFVYVSGVGAAKDAPQHWFRFKWMAEDHLQKERARLGRAAADVGVWPRRPRAEQAGRFHQLTAVPAAVR